ncbi:glycosyltransferase [Oscillospiraceae bacterium MB24-C1]|nr:glycosyltransferase [Oscillospiraceae bacterium MB24-C1]
MPLISVIMGVYFVKSETAPLERAVCSILDQSFSDFELLICDDGSSVPAQGLLERMAEKDARIRLMRRGDAITLPQKLNFCLTRATGRFIARMDDDDFSHPQRFERQYDYLVRHPEIAFVGCNINRVFNTCAITPFVLPEFPKPRDFLFVMPYIHPTLLFRREVLEMAGSYCEKKYCLLCEDYDLLLRLYHLGFKGANLQEFLFDYSMAGVEERRRKYRFRINEATVRLIRFGNLGMLPQALPYVVKPLIVGLLPLPMLNWLRRKREARKRRKFL